MVSTLKDAVMCSARWLWRLTSVFILHIRPHADDAAQSYLALSFFGSNLSFHLPLMPFMFSYFSCCIAVSETLVFYSHYTHYLFFFFYIENCTEKSDFPSNKAENNWETLETLFSKSSHEQLLVFLTKEFYHPGTKGRGGGVLIMTYLLSNPRNVAKIGQILG